jgi:uncharacterized membrane protein
MENRSASLLKITMIGVMAAMVFVATMFFKFDIPTPPDKTMIKLGNAVCVLSGLLLGGVGGGLASGIGSALFDLFDPVFAPEAWVTFIRFFLMGFIAGAISHAGKHRGENFGLNLTASIVSSVFSFVFYIAKAVATQMMLAGDFSINRMYIALGSISTKIFASGVNAVAAIVIAMVLIGPLSLALKRSGVLEKLRS